MTPKGPTQRGRYISVPRAMVTSPRSMTCFRPNDSFSRPVTFVLAEASLPHRKRWCSPPAICPGSIMTTALTELSAFTTRTPGSAAGSLSPNESVFAMRSVGGIPLEEPSGLEMSMRILPSRPSALAIVSVAIGRGASHAALKPSPGTQRRRTQAMACRFVVALSNHGQWTALLFAGSHLSQYLSCTEVLYSE